MNSINISPNTNKTLGEIYAFLMERRIERKVASKVIHEESLRVTKNTDTEPEMTNEAL